MTYHFQLIIWHGMRLYMGSHRCVETGLQRDAEFSGTTFVCAVIRGVDLWVANIGDSRVTAGNSDSPP